MKRRTFCKRFLSMEITCLRNVLRTPYGHTEDGINEFDRLEGLQSEVADWHAKLNLYEVIDFSPSWNVPQHTLIALFNNTYNTKGECSPYCFSIFLYSSIRRYPVVSLQVVSLQSKVVSLQSKVISLQSKVILLQSKVVSLHGWSRFARTFESVRYKHEPKILKVTNLKYCINLFAHDPHVHEPNSFAIADEYMNDYFLPLYDWSLVPKETGTFKDHVVKCLIFYTCLLLIPISCGNPHLAGSLV